MQSSESIPRRKPSTTPTEAFCSTSCDNSWPGNPSRWERRPPKQETVSFLYGMTHVIPQRVAGYLSAGRVASRRRGALDQSRRLLTENPRPHLLERRPLFPRASDKSAPTSL